MSHFTEANTIEDAIRATLTSLASAPPGRMMRDLRAAYTIDSPSQPPPLLHWQFIPAHALPRTEQDVLVEPFLHAALLRLNPEIAAHPAHADEVIYRLRGILLSAASSGLVRANEAFTAMLRDDLSMPFGPHHEHVPERMRIFGSIIERSTVSRRSRHIVVMYYAYSSTS